MSENNSKAKERVSLSNGSATVSAAEKRSQESEKVQKEPAQQSNDDKATQATVAMKRENDAYTTNMAEEHSMVPVRHPKLPSTTPPRYFVNKSGLVCSNATGKLRSLKPSKLREDESYKFCLSKDKDSIFRLDEIMVYTFSEHFDGDKHHIVYKDGNQKNLKWDNFIICDDLPTRQQKEITILERLNPGTRYTVVRNIHDTLTFERYLVSDAGKIYSLCKRQYLRLTIAEHGHLQATLVADTSAERTIGQRITLAAHGIVMQSFNGRRPEKLLITHINGNKRDNMLENLEYIDPTRNARPPRGYNQEEAEKQKYPSRKATPVPLPPITEETRWKTIEVLPWNGLSFSHYEVSDMGHVRNKDDFQLRTLWCTANGYAYVSLFHDEQELHTYPKLMRISRLVANAFVDGYSETQNFVMHLNGDRLDNRAQNLKWVSTHCSSVRRNAYRVVASLVDDPKVRKEFPSMLKASRELSTNTLQYSNSKFGNSFTKEVTWDGEKKMVLFHISPSNQNEE